MKTTTLIRKRIAKAEKKFESNMDLLISMLIGETSTGIFATNYYKACNHAIEAQQEIKTLKWVLEEAI